MTGALAVSASWAGDVVVPVVVAVFAAVFAVWWPYLQTRRRASQFQTMIARELKEIGPRPHEPGDWWWQRLQRRFVHEELMARGRVSDNRDFLLTLNPNVVYHLFQLWVAFDKGNGIQWRFHLCELSKLPAVASDDLSQAAEDWWLAVNRDTVEHSGEVQPPPARFIAGSRPDDELNGDGDAG
jgi:hypothetical protein